MAFTNDERKEFAMAVTLVAESFRQTLSGAQIGAYEIGLDDLPIADVKRACVTAIRQCRFMPAVAELRELAGVQVPRLDGGKSAALAAWSQLQRARSEHYLASAVEFEDLAITATVRALGGWERLLGLPDEQFEVWLKKEFLELYPVMVASPNYRLTVPLIGYGSDLPVRIGRGGVATVKALPAPARSPEVAGLLEQIGKEGE